MVPARGTSVAVSPCMRHLLVLALAAGCVATDEPRPLPESPDDPTPEVPTPDDPTPPTTESPGDTLLRWQQCMTFADFQAANMAGAWTSVATTPTGQQCASCHQVASYGFVATSNAQQFFDVLEADVTLLSAFVDVTTLASQPGAYQVVVDEQTIPGAGSGDIPEHPRFNPAAGMTALRDFHQRTEARCANPL